jgi:hypothetical protein
MKLAALSGVVVLAAFILPGCPVYPRDQACYRNEDCPSGSVCGADGYCAAGTGGSNSIPDCDEPRDCRANETCGSDGRCHVGSCQFHGCVAGTFCGRADGVWTCLPGSGTGGRGGAGGTGGSAGSGGGDADVSDSADGSTPEGSAGAGGDDAGADAEPDGSGGTSDASSG